MLCGYKGGGYEPTDDYRYIGEVKPDTKEGRDYYLRQIRRIETRLLSLEKAKDDHPETIQLKETLIKIKDRLGE